jgi:predicted HTH transcriptional regulator
MKEIHDWDWLQEQEEGQFLERKSCYDRSAGQSRPRSVKEVLQDVAETLVAMANADGGTVAVGLEDDGTVTGVPSTLRTPSGTKAVGRLHSPYTEIPSRGDHPGRAKGLDF